MKMQFKVGQGSPDWSRARDLSDRFDFYVHGDGIITRICNFCHICHRSVNVSCNKNRSRVLTTSRATLYCLILVFYIFMAFNKQTNTVLPHMFNPITRMLNPLYSLNQLKVHTVLLLYLNPKYYKSIPLPLIWRSSLFLLRF